MKTEGISYILSAPSGTGKSTVIKRLRELAPNLKLSISHTTRSPRKNEVDGEDYFFISEDEFKARLEKKEFLEWARVHNNYYGTARQTVDKARENGWDVLLEIDVQGVQTLRDMTFPGVYIFIVPPSLDELRRRLVKRGTEPEEKIEQRLQVGKEEIKRYKLYDYIVANHDVEETATNILSIFRAAPCETNRFQAPSEDIQALLESEGER